MIGVHRLRSLRRDELSWRLHCARRVQQERVATMMWRPQWRRAEVRRVLAGAVLDADTRAALEREDWMALQQRLSASIRSRSSRFVLDSRSAGPLRREILTQWPNVEASAAQRADRVVAGRYDLLGYSDIAIDVHGQLSSAWHRDPVHGNVAPMRFWADVPYLDPSCGDHKIIWELNRHQHWLVLGRALWLTHDRRYADEILRQLQSWLAVNPPLVGINWASMLELGFRSLSWLWALSFLLADDPATDEPWGAATDEPWLVDMMMGIDRQLTQVTNHLSYYFSPNTHLTGEALALYVVGHALPELARSGQWVDVGRRVLLSELEKQVCRDGGHAERSTHYHRYTLDFYLMALLVAEQVGDDDASARFRDACERLAVFAREVADDEGRMPRIGDDDGGMLWTFTGRPPYDVRDSLVLASTLLRCPALAPWGAQEEAFWLAWSGHAAELARRSNSDRIAAPRRGACRQTVFADTGYVVMRDDLGGHLVFDVGEHGYLNGGHAHADALAITLGLHGHPFLIDPGTCTYTTDLELRNRMRSSALHNTVTVDGRSSAAPAGPFHWRTRANGSLAAAADNAGFTWAEASHDAYGRDGHRRTVFHTVGSGWWIFDEIASAQHRADVHWHFDPTWPIVGDTDSFRADMPDGRTIWMLHDGDESLLVRGDTDSGIGWCAPVYGQLVPTTTGRVSRHRIAPFAIVTWVGTCRTGVTPVLEYVGDGRASRDRARAVRVHCGDATWVTTIRPTERTHDDPRELEEVGYHTDARLLHYEMRAGCLRAMAIADFSDVAIVGAGQLSVAADDWVSDLHIAVNDGSLDLLASAPLPSLRLRGPVVASASVVRLNGREHHARTKTRSDTLVLHASDWTDSCAASPASLI